MFYLFKLILLCAVCNFATAKYFDWAFIMSTNNAEVFFDLKIQRLTTDKGTIGYPIGTISFKNELPEDYKLSYELTSEDGDQLHEVRSVCEHDFYWNFLQPFTANSDYKSSETCPISPGKFSFNEVDDKSKIEAPSNLKEGIYRINVKYLNKEGQNVGSYLGAFKCHN